MHAIMPSLQYAPHAPLYCMGIGHPPDAIRYMNQDSSYHQIIFERNLTPVQVATGVVASAYCDETSVLR